MAAIFAIEKNGVTYVAADAVIHQGGIKRPIRYESNIPLRVMPSGIVVASLECNPASQMLMIHDEWFELGEGEVFDKRFVVGIMNKLCAELRPECFEDDDRSLCKMLSAAFIIAKGTDIFIVFNNLSVSKCRGYAAVTNNDTDTIMAMGARLNEDEDPERLIKSMLKLCSERDNKVSSFGYIVNTRDLVIKNLEDVK